ncbi:hypothetical protein Hypma_016419 [Hypsizygus marmoreus]|uniref:F-box domain-containing protein n=1 Tax=Hypsizygus marmoreus TaxID=39966 RepID=A0A369IYT3_HYPMA|nr:hypothetical protein Hypma_016419 [Hypsizygus marmoreus]
MHHCLRIPEIVAQICDQSLSLSWKRGSGTVVALARTCRAFHEPATAHLWYEIDTLIPLVKCMPADLWTITGENSQTLVFNRAVFPTDWPRFTKYARHVRRFGFRFWHWIDVSVSVYESLHLAAAGQVLLPHLKELYWSYGRADGALPFICLFMPPNLCTFHISTHTSLPIIASLVANLSSRYPLLSDVALNIHGERDTTSAVSTAVCAWHRLRRLYVTRLNGDALLHAAKLPELQHISFTSREGLQFPDTSSISTFPALVDLLLDCDDFSFCVDLLRSMAPGAVLEWISLKAYNAPPPGFGWRDLANALHDTCSHSSPQRITIWDDFEKEDGSEVEDFGEDLMIVTEHLRPLLHFSHITNIDLYSRYGFDLDDTLLRDLAKAWPRLQYLSIKGGPPQGRIPRVTIASLRILARHCKHLQTITMAFDARLVPPPKASQRVFSTRLFILDVIGSSISNAVKVAAFLSDVFPRLASVTNCDAIYRRHDEQPESEMDKKWTEVEHLMRDFAIVRAQETARRNPVASDDE